MLWGCSQRLALKEAHTSRSTLRGSVVALVYSNHITVFRLVVAEHTNRELRFQPRQHEDLAEPGEAQLADATEVPQQLPR
jgi:hypothetical protein